MNQLSRPQEGTFVSRSQYRVLYADTDAMGIVYNGHYFRFFEQARGEYLHQRNLPYSVIEQRGLRTPLTEAYAHYFFPFHYDELIRLECWISQIKRASFRFEYRLSLADQPEEIRVSGHTVHATVDYDTHKVMRLPQWLIDAL